MTSLEKYFKEEEISALKRIGNSTSLIKRFESVLSEEERQDIIAEIDVGLHHIQKNHNIEYEPKEFSKPPEYRITCKNTTFFVEVKRLREHVRVQTHRKIISDLNVRWKKLSIPYQIVFTINDDVLKGISQNKIIIRYIKDHYKKIIQYLKDHYLDGMDKRCAIHLDERLLGYFRTFKGGCTIYDGAMVYGSLDENIGEQLKKANEKTRSDDKPYVVVLKLPISATDDDVVRGLFGKPTARLIDNGVFGPTYREDKCFGHKTEYHKISAVLFYRNTFKPANVRMCINPTADAKLKVDSKFLRKYF